MPAIADILLMVGLQTRLKQKLGAVLETLSIQIVVQS